MHEGKVQECRVHNAAMSSFATNVLSEECCAERPSRANPLDDQRSRRAPIHHNIFDKFFLVVANDQECTDPQHKYFSIDKKLTYVGFCDDFGPMSLGMVYEFCNIVDFQLAQFPDQNVTMQTQPENQTVTNAVFLIGAYLIMKLGMTPSEVEPKFEALSKKILSYRDVSPGAQNFQLYVKDCWNGLSKAKDLHWVDFGPNGFDPDEYAHYDDPLNADLHEVVPGKFLAMRGPKDLHTGAPWRDVLTARGTFSHREFSPDHFVDILQQFNVQAVVRLNAPDYDERCFSDNGIALVDLFFEDCTPPPVDVVAKFMTIAEGLPGALAVHCKAGLGRTGTLIGLYMMKHHGFTAREAMGWLRIVRPGSVIGTQQQFLCSKEALMHKAGDKFRRDGPQRVAAGPDLAHVHDFVDSVLNVIDRRISNFHAAAGGPRAMVGSPRAAVGAGTPPGPVAAPAEAPAAEAASCRPAQADGWGGAGKAAEALAEHVSAATDRRNGLRAVRFGSPKRSVSELSEISEVSEVGVE